jgi:hypothetical protein
LLSLLIILGVQFLSRVGHFCFLTGNVNCLSTLISFSHRSYLRIGIDLSFGGRVGTRKQ